MQSLIYRTLWFLQLQHRYFLNRGEELFEDMSEANQALQLQGFDWRESLLIFPIGNTQKKLNNNHLLLRHTADSLIILVRMLEADSQQPFVSIPQDETLIFGIAYQNPLFENFTEMDFLGERKIFLANNVPGISGFDAFQPLPVEENQLFSESFVINGAVFQNLLEEYKISGHKSLKGLLSLQMNGLSGEFNILNETGTVKISPTSFFLTFDNRKTIWKYLQPTIDFTIETLEPKPLTKSGFVSLNVGSDFAENTEFPPSFHFPNPSIHSLKRDEDKIISEIYL